MSLLGPLLSTFGSARSTPSGNRSSINTTPFSRSTTSSETQDDSSNIPNQNRTTRKKKKRAWLGFGKEKLKLTDVIERLVDLPDESIVVYDIDSKEYKKMKKEEEKKKKLLEDRKNLNENEGQNLGIRRGPRPQPIINPDGSTSIMNPDGSVTTKKPDGTVTTRPPSGSTGQTPSGNTGQTPSGSTGQTPSGSTGQTPPGSTGQTPSGSTGQTPSGSTGQTPPGSTGQTPPGSTGQTPPGSTGENQTEPIPSNYNFDSSINTNDQETIRGLITELNTVLRLPELNLFSDKEQVEGEPGVVTIVDTTINEIDGSEKQEIEKIVVPPFITVNEK